ncbi:IS110 family transposase (plasmid) [Streptomyces sp. NBC_01717]|uniref:transposase n=1 Tax=Streptomyces sp. NBC_01717 TaxID=2975918 RepID=UPI002E33EF94|nr:transposase [Streptomyces sp. NBC_01717]
MDDRTRFETGQDLKAYAGSAPVTRESGKSRCVSQRRIKNSRLAATGRHWAFSALTASHRRPYGSALLVASRMGFLDGVPSLLGFRPGTDER